MASEVRATFEFEIGELVYIRSANHAKGVRPRRFIILERIVQQCCGGIQLFYLLDDPNIPQRSEILLTREEPAYRPDSAAERNDTYRQWASAALDKTEGTGS